MRLNPEVIRFWKIGLSVNPTWPDFGKSGYLRGIMQRRFLLKWDCQQATCHVPNVIYAICALFCCLFILTACGNPEMNDQKKYEPLEPSAFWDDGKSARELMPNTVALGNLRTDTLLYAGLENGQPAATFPFTVTETVLQRGQERYNIFCSPCHGYDGYGNGMIVQRGFSPPPSFHQERLRLARQCAGYVTGCSFHRPSPTIPVQR